MVNRLLGTTIACFHLLGVLSHGQDTSIKPQESMVNSCETQPFLSVSVSMPKRDGIPQSQISLSDPHSRAQGTKLDGKAIPNSRYEDVALVPTAPSRSRQHAIEVCGAEQGKYALTVYEHGDETYRLSVDVDLNAALSTALHSHEGRVRHYRFAFKLQKDKDEVYLTWLDHNGRPVITPEPNKW